MSQEDTTNSEQLGDDTSKSELNESQQDTTGESEGKEMSQSVREGHLRSALEKIGYDKGQYSEKLLNELPDAMAYLKDDIVKMAEEDKKSKFSEDDFERLYNERRDKEIFNESFPKIVKENYLTEDQANQLKSEVESLRADHNMTYEKALAYATKGLDSDSLRKGIEIGTGQIAPHSQYQESAGFVPVPLSKFDSMTPKQQKEYMSKSLEVNGQVVYS